ncbi:hypothetical protein RUM44_010308 [Polyplax serrata]|uniref:Peptidase S1 domain-containing protein n=1 Tax=Polyplax serrata TaxID=468196 RepID=A0ABR1AV64_POLSC
MCSKSACVQISFAFLFVVLSVTEVRGFGAKVPVGKFSGSGKPSLPSSNVQIHYNQTLTNNTDYSTTITFEIDFVNNTTSTSIINKPVGDLPRCGCYCGTGSRKHRIVGGNVTRISEYPWIAAMYRKGKFYCGGALITRRHMLTAAHCIYGFNPQDLKIVFGEHDRNIPTETDTVERKVKVAKHHPKFDLFTFNNDIGIVELDAPVQLGDHIRTTCLPDDVNFNYTGRFGIIAGWGRVEETRPTSNKLRQVKVPIISNEACRNLGYQATRITDNMICAGFENGGKDACQGDSGGPMVVEMKKGHFEVAGIVSWGRGCARPKYPGVYTRVVNYKDWIEEVIGSECFCQKP